MMVVMVFEKNIQKFSSHTVSKLGAMFRMKKSCCVNFSTQHSRKQSLPPGKI